MTTPELYAEVLALGRQEHALCTDGRWEDLSELNARRERLIAALPAAAPDWALPTLREAARLQALSEAVLRQGLADTRAEMSALRGRRAAVAGYSVGTGIVAPRASFSAAG
jgi:hypothetical protein